MATYKEISGLNIKTLSSDPSNLNEGDIWYNTTSNTLKVSPLVAAAWASGGSLLSATSQQSSMGITTAALAAAGRPLPVGGTTTAEYDGSSWTAGGALSQKRVECGGAGTQTSGLIFGGEIAPIPPAPSSTTATEEYNGTSWTTSPATLPVAKAALGSCGTQTAALGCAGYITPSDPGVQVTTSEEFNGSAWTGGGTMNTARRDLAAGVLGTQTAGLAVGGRINGTPTDVVEEYNGSSWTSVTSYPQGMRSGGGTGPQTSALLFGGATPGAARVTSTFSYDGSSWTAQAALAIATNMSSGAGANSTSALNIGGYNPSPALSAATEEYSPAAAAVKTITTS